MMPAVETPAPRHVARRASPHPQRPTAATERAEVEHLEGDVIIGANRAAIITVFDRTSRHLWMAALPERTNRTPSPSSR
jgi:IS30 family transposase